MVAEWILDTDCLLDDCAGVYGCRAIFVLEADRVYIRAREFKD
jgi:hypothetical protein